MDMLEPIDETWLQLDPLVPRRGGQVCDVEKFDATFFGVHHMQASSMDPQSRTVLEEAYMAVVDAGINPNKIRGANVGVYVASCFSESEKNIINDPSSKGAFAITGCSRAMYANRISYSMGLTGPSLLVDTACSSSMYAIDIAYAALRSGEIDAAIIGGANLILHPSTSLHFARLGVLSRTDVCSPFDDKANGYVRSEGVAAIFLQRRRNARRVYATCVHSKTNCDGYKPEGITYPSGAVQEKLLQDFYADLKISADDIGYMEAHSTGTVVGDPEECRAIDNALCQRRTEPLLVGSVKSNIGHTEPTSGIASVIKVVFAFQSGRIPPNINYSVPRSEIAALLEGRMKVVSEETDLKKPYVAVNSFGFGGANAHLLLKQFDKAKKPRAAPEDLPRIVVWSGRTQLGVETALKKVESMPLDPEYITLMHHSQEGGIPRMVFRGFTVLKDNTDQKPTPIVKDIQHYDGTERPIVWVFSGMGSQWPAMGSALMCIPQFKQSIQRCYNALKPAGLDLVKILTSDDPKMFDNIMHSFIGIAAIQIALTDVLRSFGMEPDYIIGHSTGELGCAYADGCFTAEQMILAAYYRGKVSLEKEKIKGSMAAVGLSYKQIRNMLPETIEAACHNGPDSCTISGPAEDIAQFVAKLKAQNIFAREVPCSNIPYHTRYIAHLGEDFMKYLKHIVPNPKQRSQKWLSTSVPQKQWSRPESMLSSAEYHTNNLLSSVLFEETSALLPKNALTIEIAPHGLLQSILKTSIPNGVHVGLTQRNNKNNHIFFLQALGKLYLNGLNIPVDNLYPKIEFPVSRGTETLSDIMCWDHRDDWEVYSYSKTVSKRTGEKIFYVSIKAETMKFLEGHNIDGKILIPATYYLECIWNTFAMMNHDLQMTERAVEMENVKFVRATTLTPDSVVVLTAMVHYATGHFELIEGDSLVVSGTIREVTNATKPAPVVVKPFDPKFGEEFQMSDKDLYKELRLRGYHYSGQFKGVESVRGDGQVARLKWKSNWVTFMDCMLQMQIVKKDTRDLCLPTKIAKIRIFGHHHLNHVGSDDHVDVYTSDEEARIVGGGVEIIGLEASNVQRRKPPGVPILERYQFVGNHSATPLSPADIGRFCIQLCLEHDASSKLKILEIISKPTQKPMIEHFLNAIEDLPLITGDYTILSSEKYEDLPNTVKVEASDAALSNDFKMVIDQTSEDISQVTSRLTDNAYVVKVLTSGRSLTPPDGLSVMMTCTCAESNLMVVLLRMSPKPRSTREKFLKLSSSDTQFQWLSTAKEVLSTMDLVLVAENDKQNGVIGLTNCLRKEYVKTEARCVVIDDLKAPPFDPQHPLYANQLAQRMAINVLRNGQWGTYRHLQLVQDIPEAPQSGHAYGNILHRGDLSSLKWLQGSLSAENLKTRIVYSSLNFKDVMLATGRISDEMSGNRATQDTFLGMEFAGVDVRTGRRVMGMVPKAAMASGIQTTSNLTLEVPKHWSLRDAATVPVVYLTVYYAFFCRANIRKGKSILIHAGTGGVGLAAIRTALAYGLEVFTTVSTPEKKNFLLKTFPKLKESHIGNSRDISFEEMIRRETNGKGVNFVLNSLAEEKLLASIRCLSMGGTFLEIGKFDIANDSQLGLAPFLKELSFVTVYLDLVVKYNDDSVIKEITDHMVKDIANGIIQPLPSTVFPAKEMEQAFRFLASGKHIGKVLVQVRETAESVSTLPMQVLPVVYFSPELTYILPGGLGGFGLELIDWMVIRGARKIVLSSSRGISNGYQSFRIRTWKSYGCEVRISTADISTKHGCEALIKGAMNMGPVGGIFNLAVVLKDALFENQTPELFKESFAPKANATRYLDELSRQLCPKLRHFVIFSSVSCGRGNAGQTNYGMANSIMERIIEDRVANGLPGKAIQWGAVGEVGLVAVMAEDKIDLEIGGTLQQRISSCLRELDPLLSSPDPLVASMVVAEKRLGQGGAESILETVLNIMSIRDPKSVSYSSTLAELGMDSLMAVDIKQTLEREFDLFLSPQDLRSLTVQKLKDYSQDYTKHEESSPKIDMDFMKRQLAILRNFSDEANFNKILVPISQGKKDESPVFFFTGIEGTSGQVWTDLGKQMHLPSVVIQLHKTAKMATFDAVAQFAYEQIISVLKPGQKYRIVGYSFGTVISIKVAHLLEKNNFTGKLLVIDGSPTTISTIFRSYVEMLGSESVDALVLSQIVSQLLPDEKEETYRHSFELVPTLEGQISLFQKYAMKQTIFSEQYILAQTMAVLQRSRMAMTIDETTFPRINAPICLVKPAIPTILDISPDFELGKLTNSEVSVNTIEGNHSSILENPELAHLIEQFLGQNST